MKLSDIFEWDKGQHHHAGFIAAFEQDDVVTEVTTPELGQGLLLCQTDKFLPMKVLYLADGEEVIGELILEPKGNVYQVMSVFVSPDFRRKNLSTLLYVSAAKIIGATIISGNQLSASAEKVWGKLENLCKVFDAVTGSVYPLSAIGSKIDGVEIIHPRDSKSSANGGPRFHLALTAGNESMVESLKDRIRMFHPLLKTTVLEVLVSKMPNFSRVIWSPLEEVCVTNFQQGRL